VTVKTIRELREARGWSQERLADEAGLDRSYMSGIERGVRNVSVLKIARLSRALHVPLRDLMPDQEVRGL
jgi:transcriptional regulator with XRE-family HTH domain